MSKLGCMCHSAIKGIEGHPSTCTGAAVVWEQHVMCHRNVHETKKLYRRFSVII